ncbi:MAG: peptide deformylase [Patescibacteria group bacterium]
MVKKVVQAGHPALQRKNKTVSSFKSPKLKILLEDLVDTMHKASLIGIAAPQIGENYMAFLTHPRNTRSRKLPKTDKLRVYVNPKITFKSKKKNIIYEGCGSVSRGKLFGPVSRPSEIEVEALNEKGKRFSLRCDGILARVIQHEYDHLMGAEFIGKVEDYGKVMSIEYYKKNIRNSALQRKNSKITKIEYSKF